MIGGRSTRSWPISRRRIPTWSHGSPCTTRIYRSSSGSMWKISCARAWTARCGWPPGAHIVLDRPEALTVIDVNTGRFVGHSNLEETVLQNNLEAAAEIAHQLRLRDIGGGRRDALL